MRITPCFPESLLRSTDLPACSLDNLQERTGLPQKYWCFSGTNFGPAAPSTGTIPRSRSALYRSCRFSSAPLRRWDTSRFSVCSAPSESPPLMPFSIRGNGFPIKEFYFLNLENLNILISHIIMYIFCVLYRTPYDFKDRPLCPYCLYSPHIFRNVRRWFWRYIPTGRTHLRRAPWKISPNFCSVIRIRLSYCGTVSAMKLSHAEPAAGAKSAHFQYRKHG